MLRSYPKGIHKQMGMALVEVFFAAIILASIMAGMAHYFTRDAEDKALKQYGAWMSAYVNAIAGYMSQNPEEPDVLTRVGTDWLKPVSCGGVEFNDDNAFLSCTVPTGFNYPADLNDPVVTFDYSTRMPKARIDFGIVHKNGSKDPILASKLSAEINRRIVVNQGYQHVEAFHTTSNDPAELASANLRAIVDNSIGSDIHLRLDGSNSMTASLVSESTTWAMIARDENGSENKAKRSTTGSINVNDAFIRSSGSEGYWISETHELAERNFQESLTNIKFMGEVVSGTNISKPNCAGGLRPLIFATPTSVIGGSYTTPKLLAGFRRDILNASTYWHVRIQTLKQDDRYWRNSGPEGRLWVTTRCG